VTTDGRGNCEVTCPECRRKTEIPWADVSGLPTNFLINNLLSELDGQFAVDTLMCEKHRREELKLFCRTCDQLICRECAITEHREHKYEFVQDIYPAEKKKITKVVDELKAKMIALETSLKTIKSQKDSAKIKFNELSLKVDAVINRQIEALEKKRQSLKDQLQKVARAQKDRHETQEKYFASSLSRIKTSVDVAEQVLRKGNELEILAAKTEITQQLTDVKSTTDMLPPRDIMISCDLIVDSSLDQSILQNLEKMSIKEGDDEAAYTLVMREWPDERNEIIGGPFISPYNVASKFEIRPKKETMPQAEALNKVQVNIKVARSKRVVGSPEIKKLDNGSFTFQHCPSEGARVYQIEVLLNGRHIKGSPFKWTPRSLTFQEVLYYIHVHRN